MSTGWTVALTIWAYFAVRHFGFLHWLGQFIGIEDSPRWLQWLYGYRPAAGVGYPNKETEK